MASVNIRKDEEAQAARNLSTIRKRSPEAAQVGPAVSPRPAVAFDQNHHPFSR